MAESVFTRIVRGEIPAHKIYEDDKTFAFLDMHPAQPGHTLIVPKTEYLWIWDMPEEDYHALMKSVQKIGSEMLRRLAPKHIGMSVEGTGVPHVHVHLIPFTTSEEFHHIADPSEPVDEEALAAMAKKLAF